MSKNSFVNQFILQLLYIFLDILFSSFIHDASTFVST